MYISNIVCLICFSQEEEVLRGRGLLVTGKMLSHIWSTGLGPQPTRKESIGPRLGGTWGNGENYGDLESSKMAD